jgi:hypothetical protein
MFGVTRCGPSCMLEYCKEGKMSCGAPMLLGAKPTELLRDGFPAIYRKEQGNEV